MCVVVVYEVVNLLFLGVIVLFFGLYVLSEFVKVYFMFRGDFNSSIFESST